MLYVVLAWFVEMELQTFHNSAAPTSKDSSNSDCSWTNGKEFVIILYIDSVNGKTTSTMVCICNDWLFSNELVVTRISWICLDDSGNQS